MPKTHAVGTEDVAPVTERKVKLFNPSLQMLVFTAVDGKSTVTIPPQGRVEYASADISPEMTTAIHRGKLIEE